jgi:hypothetical protein
MIIIMIHPLGDIQVAYRFFGGVSPEKFSGSMGHLDSSQQNILICQTTGVYGANDPNG